MIIRRAIGLATMKEKMILIGKDCGFFVVADLWATCRYIGLEIERVEGTRRVAQSHDQPDPEQ